MGRRAHRQRRRIQRNDRARCRSATPSPASRTGTLTIDVVHNAGGAAATTLNFQSLVAILDGRRSISSLTTARERSATRRGGNNPAVTFTTSPALQTGSGLLEMSGTPATSAGRRSMVPPSPPTAAMASRRCRRLRLSSAAATDNAAASTLAPRSPADPIRPIASLAIAPPAAGQTLDLTGSGNLATTGGILLAAGTISNFATPPAAPARSRPTRRSISTSRRRRLKIGTPITGNAARSSRAAGASSRSPVPPTPTPARPLSMPASSALRCGLGQRPARSNCAGASWKSRAAEPSAETSAPPPRLPADRA